MTSKAGAANLNAGGRIGKYHPPAPIAVLKPPANIITQAREAVCTGLLFLGNERYLFLPLFQQYLISKFQPK